ncbi:hypothetical protein SERLA73DRAFT_187185 [Serpula lacrymans var. lacrymans S7.3]|uniref:DUF1783-domain-containing protein n=2 Tax=Serpula lacrymans var. lacrymans TaxID=341189 RepID=F8Q8M3_SERL3|nr:uncharacterized protein SERLADRAFT_476602 [Serpula lacrymans var. lacrymans S7.9]EGN95911.1 hypothetical protein SERLA73DRAFT_187185 [Serpula lacrymans var. lacrymans S7.3]EGO21424.1 hypothetical protein SERLADRAFT_476602 [Serpula lacrymans var. lacrymans S7.9]
MVFTKLSFRAALPFKTRPIKLFPRRFASEPQRPPIKEPVTETFSAASKPRLYYSRPPPRYDLPRIEKKWPFILAFATLGVSAWGAFLLYATNQEKLASSVYKQILRTVKECDELKGVLGDAIRAEPAWYLNGDPWITGGVNIPQGKIDLSFRLKGHKGSGTLYFTSIRTAKGQPFTPLRFRVIGDDKSIVNIPVSTQLPSP